MKQNIPVPIMEYTIGFKNFERYNKEGCRLLPTLPPYTEKTTLNARVNLAFRRKQKPAQYFQMPRSLTEWLVAALACASESELKIAQQARSGMYTKFALAANQKSSFIGTEERSVESPVRQTRVVTQVFA